MKRLLGPLALALAWVAASPASAYTVKRTTGGKPVRWAVDRVPVQLDASLSRHVGAREARSATQMAVDAWRGLGGPELVLSPGLGEGGATRQRGTQVFRPETWPHDPRLLAVTATTYDDISGRILDADVLVNPGVEVALLEETESGAQTYDLGAILTHEMGHVLGLGESDADPLATMWPRIGRGDTHQRSVSADDEAGVGEIYAAVQLAPAAGCGGARVAAGSMHGLVPWLLAALVFGLLGWLAWRSHNNAGAASRGRPRVARSPAAGLVFAGAVVALVVPSFTGRADEEAPAGVRAARAFAAHRRPTRERAAMLEAALRDGASSVRRAALLGIVAEPRRSDAARVEGLLDDEDTSVAALALEAWRMSRRAVPEEVVPPGDRLSVFGGALRAVEVERAEVHRGPDEWLETTLTTTAGVVVVPGGCLHDVCQRFGEGPLPEVGDALYLGVGQAWSFRADDIAFGGWLGDGAGVRVAP